MGAASTARRSSPASYSTGSEIVNVTRTQRRQRTQRKVRQTSAAVDHVRSRAAGVRVRLTTVVVALLLVSASVSFVPFLSSTLGAQRSRAGAIRGRVELRHVLAAAERRPNVSDLG